MKVFLSECPVRDYKRNGSAETVASNEERAAIIHALFDRRSDLHPNGGGRILETLVYIRAGSAQIEVADPIQQIEGIRARERENQDILRCGQYAVRARQWKRAIGGVVPTLGIYASAGRQWVSAAYVKF